MTEPKPQYLTSASFLCSIPPIMSGIKTGGDGMRVQFDIPETEMGEAAKLLAMRGERLRVTVKVISLTKLDNETEKKAERSSINLGR